MTCKEFLKYFSSDHFFYSTSRTNMTQDTLSNVEKMNDRFDIYFIPNPGGRKWKDIKYTNCCFVDIDCGRDKYNKYLSPSKVQTKKLQMQKRIAKCPIQPHIIVETRNGYQLYWLTVRSENFNLWDKTQYAILQFFKSVGADEVCIKRNQIMRLPSVWYKPWENKPPFEVTAEKTFTSLRRYSLKYIAEKFDAKDNPPAKVVDGGRFKGSYDRTYWSQNKNAKTENDDNLSMKTVLLTVRKFLDILLQGLK